MLLWDHLPSKLWNCSIDFPDPHLVQNCCPQNIPTLKKKKKSEGKKPFRTSNNLLKIVNSKTYYSNWHRMLVY